MDFFEAMIEMKEGKKVRLKSWSNEKYIGISEERKKIFGKNRNIYRLITENELEVSPCLPFSVMVSSEWCLVEEID